MRDAQKRFVLADKGMSVYRRQPHGVGSNVLVEPEQVLSWGPVLECFYHVAPWAWSVQTVERPPEMDMEDGSFRIQLNSPPVDFLWIPGGPVHAVINYQVPGCSKMFSLPLIFYGLHTSAANSLPESDLELFDHLQFKDDGECYGSAIAPGAVIVASHPLAAIRARREVPGFWQKTVVCYGTFARNGNRFGVIRVDRMKWPRYPAGHVIG